MTFELYALLAAVLIGFVYLSAASFSFKMQVGNRYTVGARDNALQPTGVAGRLQRAHMNFLETFPYFATCALIVHITQTGGTMSLAGSMLYVGGRAVFLPLYAAGVPWLRTFSWNIATLGIVLVGADILL